MIAHRGRNGIVSRRLKTANTRLVAALFAALFVALTAPAQTRGPRRQANPLNAADEAAIRRLVSNFFDFLSKENLNGLSGLWSKSSPHAAPYRQHVEQQFVGADCTSGLPIVSRVRVEAGRVTLRVPNKFTCVAAKTENTWQVNFVGDMTLVKEHGRWKIWQLVDFSAEFAATLLGKTEAERARLLVEERESLTTALADVLVNSGSDYTDQNNFQQALNAYQLALRVSRQLGYKKGIRDSLWGIGYALNQPEDYDKAIADYREAISLSRELSDGRAVAALLQNVADILSRQNKYTSALDYYQQSLTQYEQLQDKAKAGELLNRIGDVYYNLHDYPKSLESYFNSLRISEDFTLRRETLDDISDVYSRQNDHKTSLAYLRKSLAPSEADESALNELTDKFFAINEPWDFIKWWALWSHNSPFRHRLLMPLEEDGGRNPVSLPGSDKNNELTNHVIKRRVIWVSNNWASIWLSLERKPDTARKDQATSAADKAERSLDFIKENGAWKVWSYYPRTKFLAVHLSYADTEGERNALLDEDPGLVNLELSRELGAAGNELMLHRKYASAREIYQLARSLAARFNDRSGVAGKLTQIAHTYDAQGEPDKALEFHRQSLAIRAELGEQEKVAESQTLMALIYFIQGDYETALDYLQQANKLLGTLTDDESKKGIVATWLLIGQIYLVRGELTLAQDYFQKGLKYSEESNDDDGMSNSWQAVGQIHMLQGDYKQAMQAFQKSQDLSGDSDDASLNRLIGITYFAQGTPNLSVKFMLKKLPPSNAASGAQPDAFTVAYNSLVQADYAQALTQFQQFLLQQETLGNKIETAVALYFIGLINGLQGNHPAEIEALQKSVSLFEQVRNKPNAAEALMYLAYAYEDARNYEKALESYQRSLQLYQAMGNKYLVCRLTLELAYFLQARGDNEQALKLAEGGHALAQQLKSSQFLWLSQTLLGRSYLALKQPALAEQHFRHAIGTVELLRTNVSGGEQERERFFENTLLPFHGMIELLAGQDQPFAALGVAEQSKARVLLDVLQGDKPDPTKPLPPDARVQEIELVNQLKDLNRRVRRAELEQPCDDAALTTLIGERRKARLEFDTFQARLATTYPELGGTGSAPHDLSRTEIADLLPDERTAILEYVVADDRTSLFVISKDTASSLSVNVHQLPIKRDDLKAKVERFRNMIAPADPEQRSHDFKTPAGELYDLLLKPAAAGLQGKTALIIIPDVELWGLPFQALQTPSKRYLLEDHALSYAPSLATLQKMMAARGRRARAPEDAGQSAAAASAQSKPLLLALGDPSLTGGTRQAGGAAPCRALPQLSAAAGEVNRLKQEIYAGFGDIYIGTAATEERFKREAGNYRVIHLATHGLLDDDDPLFSQIVLAGQDEPRPAPTPTGPPGAATPHKATQTGEDGVLEAWEIARLRLNADLVVLSACETARGRIGEGEGVIGLTWALAVAGTPTTVASQWAVNSRSTAELMVDFHRRLAPRMFDKGAGDGPSVALQRAALDMLKDSRKPDLHHPYFWAGFVVIGDGR